MIVREAGDLAPRALAAYGLAGDDAPPAIDPLYGSASAQWAADALFLCPITTEALWHSRAGNPGNSSSTPDSWPGGAGACIGPIALCLWLLSKEGNIAGRFTATDFKLADRMETYWTNFARTGDPNGEGLPHWPRLDASGRYLDFGVDGGATATGYPLRGAQCGLYREWMVERMKQGE